MRRHEFHMTSGLTLNLPDDERDYTTYDLHQRMDKAYADGNKFVTLADPDGNGIMINMDDLEAIVTVEDNNEKTEEEK